MSDVKIVEVNLNLSAVNDEIASKIRQRNLETNTYMINLMASPGAGKTTLLLKTIEMIGKEYSIGVMEADIDATVDAEKMQAAGVRSIQVHTNGECAMNASMTQQAIQEFNTEDLDLLILENVGNLVCPAETDTGATANVAILSVPEGDDKPLKYPLMFTVCQVIIISKIDTKEYFPFNDDLVAERIHRINPNARIFYVSAKTGEGMDKWTDWLRQELQGYRKNETNT